MRGGRPARVRSGRAAELGDHDDDPRLLPARLGGDRTGEAHL